MEELQASQPQMRIPAHAPVCLRLATLRSERNAALDAVFHLPKRYASDQERQAIFARLTSAHEAEVLHKQECPECRRTLMVEVA
jgi:hypothetical protein